MSHDEPNHPRRLSAWQFTLRELLLASLAFLLLVALFATAWPSRTTPFFDTFSHKNALATVCGRLQLNLKSPGGGEGVSRVGKTAVRNLEIEVASPKASEVGRVMAELRREIESLLKKSGCQIHGRESGCSSSGDHFSFEYDKGGTTGDIFVHSVAISDMRWVILILMHESLR